MRRVLVAGATGYLGRHLVARLKQDGYWVRVLVRRPEQAATFERVDDVFVGQVTRPATLAGVADEVDTVFSTIGITRQHDGVGYQQVDFGGNLALLREAERSGVERFVYVSVLHGRELRRQVRLADAKERFVDRLRRSPVPSVVVRPTGYFSDLSAFLAMARKGRVFLVGSGRRRMNPISGRDLAAACVRAAQEGPPDVEVGGPEVLTHDQIATAAFAAAGRPVRIRHLPLSVLRAVVRLLSRVAPERVYGPLQFFVAVMERDMVAPATGTDRLGSYFASAVSGQTYDQL